MRGLGLYLWWAFCMQSIEFKKIEFAKKEISSLVFQAALIRGYSTYKLNADPNKRMKFRDYLSEQLEKFSEKIPNTDEEYIELLNDFQQKINKSVYIDILNNNKITFGRVQKLLNLYLKYLWVFNFKKDEPLHCVIDSIILNKIAWEGPKWTKGEFTEKEYIKAMDICKKKAKNENASLAQWELMTFENRMENWLSKNKTLPT